MRYRITTPAEGHTGVVAGVSFRKGAAELETGTDGAVAALAYFRRRGYGIEEAAGGKPTGSGRPPQAADKAAWVAYAVTCGADQAEAEGATKATLIDQYGKGDA